MCFCIHNSDYVRMVRTDCQCITKACKERLIKTELPQVRQRVEQRGVSGKVCCMSARCLQDVSSSCIVIARARQSAPHRSRQEQLFLTLRSVLYTCSGTSKFRQFLFSNLEVYVIGFTHFNSSNDQFLNYNLIRWHVFQCAGLRHSSTF